MQKVVGFFSKPENLFVLTLLIGLFTGTYKVVSKASNHNNSLYQRVSSPICFYLRLFGYVYTLPWIGSLLISGEIMKNGCRHQRTQSHIDFS